MTLPNIAGCGSSEPGADFARCAVRPGEGGRAAAVDELARRFGQPSAVFTASGSAAIEVALEVLGIGRGDEVVVPDVGCHSIGAAVVRQGAVPVFVGVGESLTLSSDDVSAALSPKTRAVVAAHHYGLPCDVRGIVEALPPEITVIEDVAPAWGARARGAVAGSAGAFAVTSFGPSKPVTLGGGGALLGPAAALCGAVSRGDVRDRNLGRPPSPSRLPEPLLDLLPAALAEADRRLAARRAAVAAFLGSDLSTYFRLPPSPPDSAAGWTRVPLYPTEHASSAHVQGVRRLLGPIQEMHRVPPSGLPMFHGHPTRVAGRAVRPVEPLLVKIG